MIPVSFEFPLYLRLVAWGESVSLRHADAPYGGLLEQYQIHGWKSLRVLLTLSIKTEIGDRDHPSGARSPLQVHGGEAEPPRNTVFHPLPCPMGEAPKPATPARSTQTQQDSLIQVPRASADGVLTARWALSSP